MKLPTVKLVTLGFLISFSLLLSFPVQADDELGVYEHLDEFITDDLIFVDELHNEVN